MSPALQQSRPASKESARLKILEFYASCCPERLPTVDAILDRFPGQEGDVLRTFAAKYPFWDWESAVQDGARRYAWTSYRAQLAEAEQPPPTEGEQRWRARLGPGRATPTQLLRPVERLSSNTPPPLPPSETADQCSAACWAARLDAAADLLRAHSAAACPGDPSERAAAELLVEVGALADVLRSCALDADPFPTPEQPPDAPASQGRAGAHPESHSAEAETQQQSQPSLRSSPVAEPQVPRSQPHSPPRQGRSPPPPEDPSAAPPRPRPPPSLTVDGPPPALAAHAAREDPGTASAPATDQHYRRAATFLRQHVATQHQEYSREYAELMRRLDALRCGGWRVEGP